MIVKQSRDNSSLAGVLPVVVKASTTDVQSHN